MDKHPKHNFELNEPEFDDTKSYQPLLLEELTFGYINRLERGEGGGKNITIAGLRAEHGELAEGLISNLLEYVLVERAETRAFEQELASAQYCTKVAQRLRDPIRQRSVCEYIDQIVKKATPPQIPG